LYVGDSIVYTLPAIIDNNGITVTTSTNMGAASTFTTFNNDKFYIQPPQNFAKKSYVVSVTLTDSNGLTEKYTFTIYLLIIEVAVVVE
jgi:hypothetical protein